MLFIKISLVFLIVISSIVFGISIVTEYLDDRDVKKLERIKNK